MGPKERHQRPRGRSWSWIRTVPAIAAMAALFALSSIPGSAPEHPRGGARLLEWLPPEIQNLLHVPAFGVLAILCLRATAGAFRHRTILEPSLAVTASAGYALLDEWYQTTVPGRTGSLTDLTLDLAGIAFGTGLYLWIGRSRGWGA